MNLKINVHLLFISLISLGYIIPLLLFENITLFYIDALDSEIVYNKIIGKFLSGDTESINVFLNGEIKIEYLRRVFHPYMFLYAFLNTKTAYFTIDILVKAISYYSFNRLAKKINENIYICALISCLYASINLPTWSGFGLAVFPYFFYLIIYKKKITLKHYIVIFFSGLNSDIVMTGLAIPTIMIFFFISERDKIIKSLFIFLIFSFAILISNFNLIYLSISGVQLHRLEFLRESFGLKETFIHFFYNLFKIPQNTGLSFLYSFPQMLFIIPTIAALFFYREKQIITPLLIVIITALLLSFLKFELVANLINNSNNLIKTFSWNYLSKSFILFYCLSLIFIFKKKTFFTKILNYLIIISIISLQINSFVVPFVKEKILKIKNYQNLYTFEGYYNYYNYNKIKQIVKEKRVISVGVDPMVAAYHGIKIIDGYHNTYPLAYKKKFRKIIENELNKNLIFKEYFDQWGSRVYTTLYHYVDINNIQLNFKAAKEIGAYYIVSKYKLDSNDITLISDGCYQNDLCLYEIN